ncbi:hypothetical protein [Streptomyces sp. TRM68367]|uniref:hypothetical protein n=1 Tax=Streptomyces sp. TRM68367 TaxID=2758415 RepID=UPI00165C5786|nr:hypothetical protein [Streptomyces sp. TRM68367]MBC9724095.1 hypothetical protein [Streptomyces sp. TRM68367]
MGAVAAAVLASGTGVRRRRMRGSDDLAGPDDGVHGYSARTDAGFAALADFGSSAAVTGDMRHGTGPGRRLARDRPAHRTRCGHDRAAFA